MAEIDTQWMTRTERSHAAVIRFMVWLSLGIGRRTSRLVLLGIAAYFLVTGGAARRASHQYLDRVLGRRATLRDGFRHVFAFSSVIHDRIYLLKDRFEEFDIQTFGETALTDAIRAGTPVMLLGSHLGSFELLRAIGAKDHFEASQLMYVDNAQKLNTVLGAINPQAMQNIIELKQVNSMLRAQEALSAGHVLGMLADRGLGGEKAVAHEFLGAPALLPHNPFRLTAALRCKVFFAAGLYMSGNRYEAHFVPLADFSAADFDRRTQAHRVTQLEQAYIAQLAHFCRYAPYNWFNFFDFWQAAPAAPS